MKKLDLDSMDVFDIENYTQEAIKDIDDKIKSVFSIDADELYENIVVIVETLGYLTNRLYKEKLLLNYYTQCFSHVKEKLLVKYKYGSIRDLDRIESMIETSSDWKKYDGIVFSQNLICEHIQTRMKIIKNQIFNIKDIIDIKKFEAV